MGKSFSLCCDISNSVTRRNGTLKSQRDMANSDSSRNDEAPLRTAINEERPNLLTHQNMHYKMDHEKRGLALIFNHEFFAVDGVNSRTGTNVDCENLTQTLRNFRFEVRHFHDLTYESVCDCLRKVAEMDHSQHDCLLVVVLSHGELGELYAHDRKYRAEIIWSSFTSAECPSLDGKPRLFFIQACRGDQTDDGIKLQFRSEPDGHPNVVFRIPTHRDFLIAYSTIPGFYSWRNKREGSWFVQALCSELNVYGDKFDLLTILTFVSQRIAIDFESYLPEREDMHKKKQIPAITTMLTRLLKLTANSQIRRNDRNDAL